MKNSIVEATHASEDRIKKYYTWRASNYDAGAKFEVEHHAEAVHLAEIQKGQRVLDAACGTGRGTVGLAEAVGLMGRVDALDLTQAMLDKAKAKMDQLGLGRQVFFQQGNARNLPYEDQTFDVVYNGYMFDLIPLDGFLPILNEFRRVSKPGGKLVLVNMSKQDGPKTFYEKIYEKKLAVMPCRPVLMTFYLEQAGFQNIKRMYRPSHGFIVSKLWGTEIVLANTNTDT